MIEILDLIILIKSNLNWILDAQKLPQVTYVLNRSFVVILFSEAYLSTFQDSPIENSRTQPTGPITNVQVPHLRELWLFLGQLLLFRSALMPNTYPFLQAF